jgi:tRNA modification GTPase
MQPLPKTSYPLAVSYLSDETICAISTELGGAVAIVRVSGENAFESLHKLTRSEILAYQAEPRKLYRTPLYAMDGSRLDDALVVRFVQPASYTGENMVEYHIHGGRFIGHKLIETLLAAGLRQAMPGEFSFRSVRNGKLDLYQAQAVADLIAASNEKAIELALEKLSGQQASFLNQLSAALKNVVALSEIGIDFSDQDVEEVSLRHLKLKLTPIRAKLEELSKSYQRGLRLQEGFKVSFLGAPNAGKSSFFNALLGENRSIVSEIAGTTRDVIGERLNLRGNKSSITLRLEDTAGIRHAQNAIEKEGIERTLKAAQGADLVLFIVDCTFSKDDIDPVWKLATSYLEDISKKTIGILTKCDLLNFKDQRTVLDRYQSLALSTWVLTSAKEGTGISEAVERIVEYGETHTRRDPKEILLTRLEHFNAVTLALKHLERAVRQDYEDLFASDTRQALHALAPLIGETLPDDILNTIFSQFCIGK